MIDVHSAEVSPFTDQSRKSSNELCTQPRTSTLPRCDCIGTLRGFSQDTLTRQWPLWYYTGSMAQAPRLTDAQSRNNEGVNSVQSAASHANNKINSATCGAPALTVAPNTGLCLTRHSR